MEWISVKDKEPPRNEEILFMTGDETIHYGEIFDDEELKKCKFHSFTYKTDYDANPKTCLDERVIYWYPIPKKPN